MFLSTSMSKASKEQISSNENNLFSCFGGDSDEDEEEEIENNAKRDD